VKWRALGPVVAVALALGLASSPLLAQGVAATKSGPVPPFTQDFFGMTLGADLTQASDIKFDTEMNLMHQIGVHWVRAIIPWGAVEHDFAGEGEWTLVDRLVETVQAEGMQLVGIIDNPPIWASTSPPPVPGCPLTPAFDLQAYTNFAAAVASRYTSSGISAIEVENSPNLPGTWTTPDPCAYSQLMKDVYPAVKAADHNILVLNGGVGGTQNSGGSIAGDTWIADLYAHGAKGTFDVVSFHPYSYPCIPSQGCPTRTWGELTTLRQTMTNNGDANMKVWATEFGSPTNGRANDGHVTEAMQSTIMIDGMKQWVTFPWGGPFFVYEFRDFGTKPGVKSDWFGIVSSDFQHKKPAYFAYQYEATGKGTPPPS
jgi:hypothetical protein